MGCVAAAPRSSDGLNSDARAIPPIERAVLLFCFHYDPASGKYTLAILNWLKLAAGMTLVVIGFFFIRSWRRAKPMISSPPVLQPEPRASGTGIATRR